ncbi:MAG: hypothetical protein UT86_C0007G0017 [Candidatus Magasanikbacteria bacterium GW2011_GWC2_40_17]|uniref:Protein kinase domain-containing protein n=1 Tax=Candidatus Magasanikbacteria bacterium GW2011_GWA2_42_32 TaxID=1619039 RepID=A0A0G1CCQ3_9BACT|nr:MAG: hypothetical protein UT86_C0007G0017 [Candidatus Magasanikbacteria bacterium GW2011_GWC2_40_17]KKS56476.1 MAG: hypothetical protein UV20_C0011G0017 [Candidatus Magasanikbacteria bacterium GW2011_GWA2_42_32]
MQGQATKETPEARLKREMLEGQVELALYKFAKKFNEGTSGVVFKIDLNNIPELSGLKDAIEKEGQNIEGAQAIKIVKIYIPGAGRREFEMQTRAWEIFSKAKDKTGLAKVARPLKFFDIPVDEETKKKLRESGVTGINNRVEVIIMDYIPGTDLATLLYREAIRRDNRFAHLRQEVDELPFDVLQKEISQELFYAPKSKARDATQKQIDAETVWNQNAQILYNLLHHKSFVLNPQVLSQIEKTIKLFHNNGFCFRDGHQRNFLIEGDLEGGPGKQEPRVTLIDFGSSTTFEGEFSEELYQDGGKRYYDDLAVVRDLTPLCTSRQEELNQESQRLGQSLIANKERLKSRKEYLIFLEQTKEKVKTQGMASSFDHLWAKLSGLPLPPFEYISATILELIDQGAITLQEAKDYLVPLITKDPKTKKTRLKISGGVSIENKIRSFIKILENY